MTINFQSCENVGLDKLQLYIVPVSFYCQIEAISVFTLHAKTRPLDKKNEGMSVIRIYIEEIVTMCANLRVNPAGLNYMDIHRQT